jgi:hypothetical protein
VIFYVEGSFAGQKWLPSKVMIRVPQKYNQLCAFASITITCIVRITSTASTSNADGKNLFYRKLTFSVSFLVVNRGMFCRWPCPDKRS